MKTDKLQAALNKQINAEMFSAYLYLSMAAYFEQQNLKGCAHWMEVQAQEEMNHAMKIYKFVHDRRWEVKLTAIAAPKTNWSSPLAVFEEAFKHEQLVTKMIHDLLTLAISSHDYPTQVFLQWFVDEQVEEESSADDIVQQLKMISKNPGQILMLDKELRKRKDSDD